jgi:hypothetical protein
MDSLPSPGSDSLVPETQPVKNKKTTCVQVAFQRIHRSSRLLLRPDVAYAAFIFPTLTLELRLFAG